ncbi:ATP-binding cassette sub-family B member 5, partial [Pyricularia oryzae Y34]
CSGFSIWIISATMMADLHPWISISRGCCGAAALFVALVPTPALNLFGIGRAIRNKNRVDLFSLLALFCYVEAFGFAILLQRATAGDLIFFIPVWQKLWYQFGELMRNMPELVGALSDAAPLRRILEKGTASARQTNGQKLGCTKGSLELVNVSFTYPGMDKPVIDRLNMAIKPATKVALLGPSGAGKTTLLRIFMRYLSPSSGVVLINGQNIENIDKDSFHNFVGIMPQMPYIFNTTVMENIRLGKADASDEEVYEGCRNAMIHDTIMARPHGDNTQIGEQGGFLSGGEKQRIEFARLFFKAAQGYFIRRANG